MHETAVSGGEFEGRRRSVSAWRISQAFQECCLRFVEAGVTLLWAYRRTSIACIRAEIVDL